MSRSKHTKDTKRETSEAPHVMDEQGKSDKRVDEEPQAKAQSGAEQQAPAPDSRPDPPGSDAATMETDRRKGYVRTPLDDAEQGPTTQQPDKTDSQPTNRLVAIWKGLPEGARNMIILIIIGLLLLTLRWDATMNAVKEAFEQYFK